MRRQDDARVGRVDAVDIAVVVELRGIEEVGKEGSGVVASVSSEGGSRSVLASGDEAGHDRECAGWEVSEVAACLFLRLLELHTRLSVGAVGDDEVPGVDR